MITIDGALGEGGGQILRSALTLSAVTGKPFTIKNIRANRPKPGLQAQHLKSVEAAAAICQARVAGSALHSTELTFEPREIISGEYRFDIGTAGATTLVLQTIFIPLSLAKGSSRATITGGTHVPWSPSFHYLEMHWLQFMERLGFRANLKMIEAGFYPQGGGNVTAEIHPVKSILPLRILERGNLKTIHGISAYANLELSVAERQKFQACDILRQHDLLNEIEILKMPARGKNTMLLLLGEFEYSKCCYFSLGARGKPAETVAREAAQAFLKFLNTSGVFDEYLADQLLIPLALAQGPSEFKTPVVTQHLLTNLSVIQNFINAEIKVEGKLGEEGRVKIQEA
jgi:RNA 3'-terminal phosphate cyclase (ATP)